jgi:hypothetical protein
VAVCTTLLTALYPVFFAQSTLAHADMFAAAATLWGLVFFFVARRRPTALWGAVACFAVAAWCKETAVVTPAALAAWELLHRRWRPGLEMLLPPLLLLPWFAYFRHRTGFFFGDPQFFSYNAAATMSPLRFILALAHRILHLTAHMNMFVPVLCTLGALLLLPMQEGDGSPRPRISPPDQAVLYLAMAANLVFYSALGGALLTRYLLPLYPLVLLICVSTFYRRVPYWWGLVVMSAAAFIIGLFINPPYKFAPEDNLNYADVIRLHQQAIRQIVTRFPGSTILTAWPASDELTKPELGYVKRPQAVVKVANFSLDALQKAANTPQDYTVGFAFSTKYDPPHLPFDLGARNEALDTRFFDFHRDLMPSAIAHLLQGTIVWRDEHQGEWAAVLHFNRPQVAEAQDSAGNP